jgi:phospholipid transport system substrate-binding protein
LEKYRGPLREASMNVSYLVKGMSVLFLVLGITASALGGEPTDKIRQTTDKILSILADPSLKNPSKAEERRKLIRKAVDERFNWEEMARRSLARHWAARTDEEKKEFVRLFGDLLERTYMSKVEGYSGEKVLYEAEKADGEYATVSVKIVTKKNVDIPVMYRLKKGGDDWLVYDISIEGVSLVNNYRTQFNSIITQSSYENLIKKLKEKGAQK